MFTVPPSLSPSALLAASRPAGGGGKNPPSEQELISKYGPYVKGRWGYADLVGQMAWQGSRNYGDTFRELAKKYGFEPEWLLASAGQEGLKQYHDEKWWTGDEQYPVPGYGPLGLDFFYSEFPALVKEGFLDENFKDRFKLSRHLRKETKKEKESGGTWVDSADFRTVEDALTAKAAWMARNRKYLQQHLNKRGIKASPDMMNFLVGITYNRGLQGALNDIDEWHSAGYFKDERLLRERPATGVSAYDHVMPRLAAARAFRDYGVFAPIEQAPPPSALLNAKSGGEPVPMYKGKPLEKMADGKYYYENENGDLIEYKGK